MGVSDDLLPPFTIFLITPEGLAVNPKLFNKFVHGHPCLEQVVLPVRDGLSILRYSRKGNSLEKLGRGE